MIRVTLDELRWRADAARQADEVVEVDAVTLRSLVEATEALIQVGPVVAAAREYVGGELLDDATVVDDGTALRPLWLGLQRVGEVDVFAEVTRARFVDEHVEPTLDTSLQSRRVERGLGPSDRERLDAELLALRTGVRGMLAEWRRRWRARVSS